LPIRWLSYMRPAWITIFGGMRDDEQNEHFRLLEDTLLYLTDPVEWNFKEEKPLIDGG